MSLRDAIMPFVPGLRRYARALVDAPCGTYSVADDLVEQAVAIALKEERLKRGGNVRTFLYSTLTSLNRGRCHATDAARAPASAAPSAARAVRGGGEDPAASRIERALARLAPELREALFLVVLERMRYEEAAEVLDVPPATMMARLTRARDELRLSFNLRGVQKLPAPPQARPRAAAHLRLVK